MIGPDGVSQIHPAGWRKYSFWRMIPYSARFAKSALPRICVPNSPNTSKPLLWSLLLQFGISINSGFSHECDIKDTAYDTDVKSKSRLNEAPYACIANTKLEKMMFAIGSMRSGYMIAPIAQSHSLPVGFINTIGLMGFSHSSHIEYEKTTVAKISHTQMADRNTANHARSSLVESVTGVFSLVRATIRVDTRLA